MTKATVFQFRIKPDLADELKKLCEGTGLNGSAYIRMLIHQKYNDQFLTGTPEQAAAYRITLEQFRKRAEVGDQVSAEIIQILERSVEIGDYNGTVHQDYKLGSLPGL